MSKKNRHKNNNNVVAPVIEAPVVTEGAPVVTEESQPAPAPVVAPVVGIVHDLGKSLTEETAKTLVDCVTLVAHAGAASRKEVAVKALALATKRNITKTQRGSDVTLKIVKTLTAAMIRDIKNNRGGDRIGEKGWWSNYKYEETKDTAGKITEVKFVDKETY